MEFAHLGLALLLGMLAKRVALPPMVGFLVAGFALHAAGFENTDELQALADFGVTLLLFTIGLKLRISTLLIPPVWAGASLHMLVTVALSTLVLLGLATTGLDPVADLDLGKAALVAFALSFSSTVFAVKVLDERGESNSLHGRIAVGILIMQDIFAVVFIAIASGKVPTVWAFALLALIPLRPLLKRLVEYAGHGELMILSGFALTISAYGVFEMCGVKGDLGALIVGTLLAGSAKADELAKALLGFKDLLLVGFFLTIGLSGPPSLSAVLVAAILLVLIPFKAWLFLKLLTKFRLRVRTALFSSATLTNYSEFGLIVGAIGVEIGVLSAEWLVVVAVALSATFVIGGPVRNFVENLYARHPDWLMRLQSDTRLPGDELIDPGEAEVIVLGMGRVGTDVYDRIAERLGHLVIGIDSSPECVEHHIAANRCVLLGDASDVDFWERTVARGDVRLIAMTMPSHDAMLRTARTINEHVVGSKGRRDGVIIAGMCEHEDEIAELEEAGVKPVYDLLGEAGFGFIEHVYDYLVDEDLLWRDPRKDQAD